MLTITQRKTAFDKESSFLEKEARDFLGWDTDFSIQKYHIYDYANASTEEHEVIDAALFDENMDNVTYELPELEGKHAFRYHQVTGQYNERQEMLQDMIQTIVGYKNVEVSHSQLIVVEGISDDQLTQLKVYMLNPVENVEISLDATSPQMTIVSTEELDPIFGFRDLTEEELQDFGNFFSMDEGDMLLCQKYFQQEARDPNMTELKVIDTYWSDHCRHTTFNTQIDRINIEAGLYNELFQTALNDYMVKRERLKRTDRPVTLMDMGTIQAKDLIRAGLLDDVEVSAEVNACALEIKVDVDGEEEDWILYFKNETHNHPTEIEPFGGASTCVGGGVRDPLSGRSWVYQAMRISGAKNPNLAWEETREDKLPQRVISQTALAGNSDYANQIGVTGAFAKEIYHDGFEAKRLEVGALISAAPRRNIIREEPEAGDKIVLLGGRTGRDGLGAAVGSSQIQTEESLETAGAEVQKGNASVERKITRLFRNGDATRLIKRCNDFGAGGVAVAVGELAPGITIDLDEVPVKYDGLHGGEIALSESQERMACVVSEENLEAFLTFVEEEDVESAVIATVTNDHHMKMTWQDKEIINIGREFLDSNGAEKHTQAELVMPEKQVFTKTEETDWSEEVIIDYMTNLNRASQQAMGEQFDSAIGRATVLHPYGGKNRKTPELGMVSRLPVEAGKTTTVSGMAYGYDPNLAEDSPFHGGYYAVMDSVARMVAMGFDMHRIRLTFQEYFERLEDDPKRWGKPVLALLGANLAMDGLQLGSIGGKDSMSGTFEELTVPPTLISFAVAPGKLQAIQSRAFKAAGSRVVLVENAIQENGTVDADITVSIFEKVHELAQDEAILAVSSVGYDGLLKDIVEMSYGNTVGINVTDDNIANRFIEPMMGSFIIEVGVGKDLDQLFGEVAYSVIGETVENSFTIQGIEINLEEVLTASEEVFASVFNQIKREEKEISSVSDKEFTGESSESNPKVLIPVILGTNSEYDMRDAFLEAGMEVDQLVIKTSTEEAFETSIDVFIQALENYQILAFASGAVFGNEPDEQGRAWELILKRDDVKEAIHTHIENKRLIFGTGTGFASLIRTGLIEFGEIKEGTAIQLLPNKHGKFISDLVEATVISSNSAWSKGLASKTYTTPVGTAWGRVNLGEAAESMEENGQIISQFNTYYAEEHIDGLASPNGLVFGTLSNIERMDDDLFKNVQTESPLPKFIQQAKTYFN